MKEKIGHNLNDILRKTFIMNVASKNIPNLCGGSSTLFVEKDGNCQIYDVKSGETFPVFEESLDRQISKIKPADVIFSCYNTRGTRLCVITKTGLLVFFLFDVDNGHAFKGANNSKLTVIYKTMRVIYSDGAIVPYRCALEDQFLHSVKDCPIGINGTILVPFGLIFTDFCAVVRVQPPDGQSILVRIAYDTDDYNLDGMPTRQALDSDDWKLVYEQGILDFKTQSDVVFILTHTCIVELWLADHNPVPILLPLPADRINLVLTEKYKDYVASYRQFQAAPLKTVKLESPCEKYVIPATWEVVLSQRPENRSFIQATLYDRDKIKPQLPLALKELVSFDRTKHEEEVAEEATVGFSDTQPTATCPWHEIILLKSHLCIKSIDGIYKYTANGWVQFLDVEKQEPVYPLQVCAAGNLIFLQEEEGRDWLAYTIEGKLAQIPKITTTVTGAFESDLSTIIVCPDTMFEVSHAL